MFRARIGQAQGFTLLEVMIALLILAIALSAISYSNSTALTQVARITRMTTAAYLMEGVVNDIHAYYVRHGFPSNTLEGRRCELPRDFEGTFECTYDLEALDIDPATLQQVLQGALEQFLGSAHGGGTGTSAQQFDPSKVPADVEKIAALAPLFGPDGEALISLCNVNLGGIIMGATALVQYIPMIVQEVARQTRKLRVRLSWNDGPKGQRDLVVETFVVSLPEEEMKAIREAGRQEEVLEQQTVPSTAPGKVQTQGKTKGQGR